MTAPSFISDKYAKEKSISRVLFFLRVKLEHLFVLNDNINLQAVFFSVLTEFPTKTFYLLREEKKTHSKTNEMYRFYT